MKPSSSTDSATATDPLLSKDEQADPSQGTSRASQDEPSSADLHEITTIHESPSVLEDALRTLAMLGMVGFGLTLILLIFTWPVIVLLWVMPQSINFWVRWLYILGIEVAHVLALIYVDVPYLYLHRRLCTPIRILLMPLLNFTIRSEAVRERETTWYNACKKFPKPSNNLLENSDPLVDVSPLLQKLHKSGRKDTKEKLRLYQQHGVTSKTIHSDFLSLRSDLPILWNHERRCCKKDGTSVLGEFVKRFLVVFLVSHAYLDQYYTDGDKCCALGLFIVCDKILMNSMYFCVDEACQYGIWQYHSMRGLLRAVTAYHDDGNSAIEYINYFQHQGYAKRLVGAMPADDRDTALMKVLFPFRFYREPPTNIIDVQIDLDKLDSGNKAS